MPSKCHTPMFEMLSTSLTISNLASSLLSFWKGKIFQFASDLLSDLQLKTEVCFSSACIQISKDHEQDLPIFIPVKRSRHENGVSIKFADLGVVER